MCGICGYLIPGGTNLPENLLRKMTERLRHRGPDGDGYWTDRDTGVALGHRRLSILDLSPAGSQPMESLSGRYVIVFNGEIYNFRELARELSGVDPRSPARNDTAVMLAAFDRWGIDCATKKFVGIFAFSVWDRAEHRLHLVRDHIGVKPLYYGWVDNSFVFASELSPFKCFPGFRHTVNRHALAQLMRYNCIPAPNSIFEHTFKLLPASHLVVNANGTTIGPVPYWSAEEVAEHGLTSPLLGSDADLTDRLDSHLRDAVKAQMVSDVPLGAFLSGGVDSSAVVAAMQVQSTRAVRTFSIGFTEDAADEAIHARAVAEHLGTDHTELYVTPADALAVIPHLPTYFDEPFADSSQIPTVLVSRLARREVAVALSGDGGDELFAGYNRHILAERLWRWMRCVPHLMRRGIARTVKGVSPAVLERAIVATGMLRSRQFSTHRFGSNLHKLADAYATSGEDALYQSLTSHWSPASSVVIGVGDSPKHSAAPMGPGLSSHFTERMMFLDLTTYLPNDILVKLDRASMAVGLEARVPLLDVRLVEFALSLPLNLKLRDGVGKWALREVLSRYVPRYLVERPKQGFSIPLESWLRGPLRAWANDLLSESQMRAAGYLNPAPIQRCWREHLAGTRDWHYQLWDVLMFQAWLYSSASR